MEKEFAFLQESNLNKIEDIFDRNTNNLLGHFELCIKCNQNINMLSYFKLCSAVPQSWKDKLKQNDPTILSKWHKTLYKDMNISKLYNRDIYGVFVEKFKFIPKSQDKWIERYPFLEAVEW